MKQVPVKLGPLALLLAVISICLTVLAILTFTTARADVRLAEKYAETVKTRYELESEGQRYLESAAGGASDGETDESGTVWKTLEKDGSKLVIGISAEGKVVSWRHEKEWEQDTDIGNLWDGSR